MRIKENIGVLGKRERRRKMKSRNKNGTPKKRKNREATTPHFIPFVYVADVVCLRGTDVRFIPFEKKTCKYILQSIYVTVYFLLTMTMTKFSSCVTKTTTKSHNFRRRDEIRRQILYLHDTQWLKLVTHCSTTPTAQFWQWQRCC